MVKKRGNKRQSEVKRFTVSLEAEDYERLQALAEKHRPPLTLQYVIRYAVHLFLERAQDPQFVLKLGDPLQETDE